jgi:hypothetical protein
VFAGDFGVIERGEIVNSSRHGRTLPTSLKMPP